MADLERIVPLSPGGTEVPLYCVHASSGSAYTYLCLAELLDPDQPVYGIEAPGFDGDRPPVSSIAELSSEYAEILREFQPDGDLALLGWSMGGTIAFATAQRLRELGTRTPRVILIDVSVPEPTELPPEKQLIRRFIQEMLATMGAMDQGVDQALAVHPDHADPGSLLLALERADALPADLDAELLIDRYPVYRANVAASFGYQVTACYPGQVTHLIATESASPEMCWGGLAADLTEHLVSGNHHSIWVDTGLQTLAKLVTAALADGRPAATG